MWNAAREKNHFPGGVFDCDVKCIDCDISFFHSYINFAHSDVSGSHSYIAAFMETNLAARTPKCVEAFS